MKSVKMFGKSVPLLAIVMISVLLVGASAALLTYYGTITSTVAVAQSLELDGFSWDDSAVIESVSGTAGNTIPGGWHYLENMADKVISFSIASSETDWPTGGEGGLKEAYPEFKLDANYYDDAFRMIPGSPVLWDDFTGISFDYEITSGPLLYIPQINIALRDSVTLEPEFGLSWNSFRTGIYGVVGTPASITCLKGDFWVYDIKFDLIEGSMAYKDLTTTLQDQLDLLVFTSFAQQAGETSVDPNTGANQQIVLVSNHVVGGGTIAGMGLYPDAGQEILDFRMMYTFENAAVPGTYTVTTEIEPYP